VDFQHRAPQVLKFPVCRSGHDIGKPSLAWAETIPRDGQIFKYWVSVGFSSANPTDIEHGIAFPVLRGIDDGSIPVIVVLDYVLAYTLNGLSSQAGHESP
jgi:hypothetical protein